MAFHPRDILTLYKAIQIGVIVFQYKGATLPDTAKGAIGSVAFDNADGKRYMKTAGGWVPHTL